MLVLSRKKDQEILIGEAIVVKVTEVDRAVASLGITAPFDVRIFRREKYEELQRQGVAPPLGAASPDPYELDRLRAELTQAQADRDALRDLLVRAIRYETIGDYQSFIRETDDVLGRMKKGGGR